MAGAEDPIIPIFRDRAPILDRIRDRGDDKNAAESIGSLVGKVIKSDSREEIRKTGEDFQIGFRQALADELGVEQNDIDDRFVKNFADQITTASEQDALRPGTLEDLGIPRGSESEDGGNGEEEQEQSGDGEDSSGEEEGETETETDLFTVQEESDEE